MEMEVIRCYSEGCYIFTDISVFDSVYLFTKTHRLNAGRFSDGVVTRISQQEYEESFCD